MSDKKKNKHIIPALLCFTVAGLILCSLFSDGFENDEANADNSAFQKDNRPYKATYKFYGGENKMYTEEITYSDSWLLQNEYKYNHSLAKASLAMSLSAFTSGNSTLFWGENGDFDREINLKEFLGKLNFNNTKFLGYNVNLNDSSSKVAYALGHKIIGNADVVCVAIRGGGYGCEWADNFKVGFGESPYHNGFLKSALNVREGVDEYIKRVCKTGKVKLWITGFSRGGAVANVLSSLYDSEKKENGYEIYAYTFATPATADLSAIDTVDDNYSNIFNIINPCDIVPLIPPSVWGFSRFGKDLYFPQYDEEKNELFKQVTDSYTELTGINRELFMTAPLKSVTDVIIKLSKDRKNYALVFEPILEDLVLSSMTRIKTDGKWTVIPFKKYIEQKYGKTAVTELDNFDLKINLSGIGDLKQHIPRDFLKFFVLCELNGVGDISSAITESLTLESAHQIAGLGGESIFSGSVSGHFPEVYLAWMETVNENEFVLKSKK